MRVNVIDGGYQGASSLIYKPPTQDVLDYFTTNMSRIADTVGRYSTGFVQGVKELWHRYNSDEALTRSKLTLHQAGAAIGEDLIYPVRESELHNANLIMQQYIMSCPEVDRLYQKDKCDGYSNTYVDPEPGVYGTERILYRNVMDGILQHDQEGQGYIMHYSHEDNNKLNIIDKMSILDTWDKVAMRIASGYDPTDVDEGTL